MSKPWDDPVANAIIDMTAAVKQLARAFDKIGEAMLIEARLKRSEARDRNAARRKQQEVDDEQRAAIEAEQSGADGLCEGTGEIHGEQLANDRHDAETSLSGNGLAPC